MSDAATVKRTRAAGDSLRPTLFIATNRSNSCFFAATAAARDTATGSPNEAEGSAGAWLSRDLSAASFCAKRMAFICCPG